MLIFDLNKYIKKGNQIHALFTGTFDPPHRGHINTIIEAININPQIDSIIMLPHNWNKNKKPVSLEKRVEWLIKIVEEFKNEISIPVFICVDKNIINNPNETNSIYSSFNQRIFRIIGKDKNIEKLQKLNNAKIIMAQKGWEHMHSTVIRKSIAEGRSDDIKDLLPECILKEILNNNYYK